MARVYISESVTHGVQIIFLGKPVGAALFVAHAAHEDPDAGEDVADVSDLIDPDSSWRWQILKLVKPVAVHCHAIKSSGVD